MYLRMLGTSVDSLAGGTGETVKYVPLSYLLISLIVFAGRCSNKVYSDMGLVYLFHKSCLQIGARVNFTRI